MMIFDRWKKGIISLIREFTAPYDYAGVHGYTVVSQNADFSLELKPDDPSVDPPLSNVQIQHDNPGMRATVPPGAACNVMFTNRDPSRPFVLGFTSGNYTLIEVGPDGFKIARQGDIVLSGGKTCFVMLGPPGTPSPVTTGVPYPVSFLSASGVPDPSAIYGGKLTGFIVSGGRNKAK